MMNYERLEEEERMKRVRAQQVLDDAKYVIRLSEMSDLELSNELDEVESTIYGGGHFVVAEAVKRLRRPKAKVITNHAMASKYGGEDW